MLDDNEKTEKVYSNS